MKNFEHLFICALLFLSCNTVMAQDPNFHLYLCFEQSNIECNARFIPQDTLNINNPFKMMSVVNWAALNHKQELTITPGTYDILYGSSPADKGLKVIKVAV